MKSIYIKLDGMKEVNAFVSILQKYRGDFDLKCGKYIVDAKSILGIFSLDTTGSLELIVYDEIDNQLYEDIKPYLCG